MKIMEVLMNLQGTHLEDDDPTTSYLLQVHLILKRSKQYFMLILEHDLTFLLLSMSSHFGIETGLVLSRHGLDYANVWARISSPT